MNKNGVKLLAAVAVFAMMFAGVAVVLSDNGDVDAASGDTTYISGTITAGTEGNPNDQNYKTGSKVVIDKDLTIPKYAKLTIEGASLTINEGVTVTIEAGGQLEIRAQDATQPTVKVNGKIVAKGIVDSTPAIINSVAASTDGKTGVFVYGNITLSEGAVMAAEGVDATVAEEGSAPNGDIVVLAGGSIDITKKNSNVSKMTDQTVYIAEGVTFTMTGFAENVTVTAYTGSDKFYQTSKVVINKTAGNTDTKKVSSIVIKTVVEKNQAKYVLTSDDSVKDKVTMKNYLMDVSGTINNKDTVETAVGTNFYQGEAADAGYYYLLDSENNPITTKKVMPTVSVSDKLVIDALGKMTVAGNTKLTVSGDVTVAYDETLKDGDTFLSNDRITVTGDLLITGTVTFNWNALASSIGTVKVDGGMLTVSDFDDRENKIGELYAAYYTVENVAKSTSTTYFCDLKAAIEGAVAAEVDQVDVFAGKTSQTATDSKDALDKGAYVVADGTNVPKGMTLKVWNALYIPNNATMTFEVDSSFETGNYSGVYNIYVDGKLVDNDEVIYGNMESNVYFQVSKYNEDTNVAVFTTLKIALEDAVSGEVITLKTTIDVTEDMTIPEGVVVKASADDGEDKAVSVKKDKTLIINGTLYLPTGSSLEAVKDTVDTNKYVGKVVLNGNIASKDSTAAYQAFIAGAYYEFNYEDNEYNVISSAKLAAERSAEIEENINFYGKISAGDLTFTEGEENTLVVTINGEFKAGAVTLDGVDLIVIGETTADVIVTVTDGQSTIGFSKVKNISVATAEADDGETITTTAAIKSYNGDVYGTVTVKNGTVTVTDVTRFFGGDAEVSAAKLMISDDAKLVIEADITLVAPSDTTDLTGANVKTFDVEKYFSEKSTFVVDGTVDVKKGTINWGISDINGQLNILKEGKMNLTIAKIDGTVNINEDVAATDATIEIAFVYGTVTGEMTIGDVVDSTTSGFLLAYPGSNITLYTDDEGTFTGEKTDVYLNGDLVFTAYTASGATGELVKLSIIDKFVYSNGLDKSTSKFYSDAALTDEITLGTTAIIGTPEVLYIEMQPAKVTGTISTGVGLSIYLDGISASAYKTTDGYNLDVGTYTISIENSVGYDKSNAVITLNGATVENGSKITINENGFVITATGAVPATGGSSSSSSNNDDGMGLTDYLLIVLVVLAAILVVIVALRMMRS